MLMRQLRTAFIATVVLIVLFGVVYPLVVTGIAQVAFSHQANGSMVKADGRVVGSALIGQEFTGPGGRPLPRYFQPRPSAAGAGYDPTQSGGSQLGPSNPVLLRTVAQRVIAYRRFNGLAPGQAVPVDAVTASGSGLDPDISEANALDQAARVAQARGVPVATVIALVHAHVDARPWGFLGENTVNVLDLNLALDRMR
jgi:potassium-transporting ATPase KdpC subunit